MSPSDLDEISAEISEWDEFYTSVTKYGFSKNFFKKENIVLSGIKTFFSIPVETTEKSDFSSVAILDETADSKETVLKVLNILNDKFQVGQLTNYVVVVGDGKSYDHLIKLKSEYGENMDWVLAYPGDWHILKNVLPIFVKIYFDAGLKQLATKHHHGATLKVLTECSKFAITHRFLYKLGEAVMRHQVKSFFEYKSCESPYDIQVSDLILDIISDMSLDEGEDDVCKTDVWEKVCEKKKEIFTFFTDDLLEEYNTWRHENSSVNQTFAFWDNFVHLDFMAYLGLFFSIRSRNWHLRNVSLKKITCLFHAFDRQNYQRLIPYHLADLHTFPEPVIKHFAAGCFSVSISGKHLYSVALDEAHEMEINLKSKNALNSFSQSSLANLTFYLPNRAKTLHNLKSELKLEREEGLYQREGTMSYVKNAEKTVCEYMSNLETSSLFVINCNENLHHIFTRTETDHEQTDSLINYRKYGEEDLGNYLKCFLFRTCETAGKPPPRKRRNLKTFASIKITIHKQKKEIKDQNTVPKAPVSSKTTVIIDGMFIINTSPLASHQTFGDYAGGFDDDRKDRAISILNGQVVDYDLASGNHEEADTRVWLHASVTTADQVIIYSPDTDGIDSILICMQLLFIYSGCAFVSYFRGCGKKTFFDLFRKHASFIVGNGSFADVHGHNGLHSFYRLICSVYFNKHRAAFQPYSTPKSLFDSISERDLHEKHLSFISAIREKLWERVVTEVEMMPNHEALKLHWMRCCWVFDYWSHSTSNTHTLSELSKSGWQITDNRLEIVWDTVLNFQKVEKTVEWYTKGCGCNTGCKTNRCKCSGDQVLDMSIDLDDVISDETEDLEDPVEDEQPEVDGLVEELDQTDDYWLFSNEEI
ncbi:unnamed protein product [Mytilus coruscus]|uniref:Uncharacterized protein n=1 Tax=Mytilus coruscus TaxID=42192 RepID=A0A6J8A1C2_MYTCO|nr:unnamed protein product [Mytilus coruscus]